MGNQYKINRLVDIDSNGIIPNDKFISDNVKMEKSDIIIQDLENGTLNFLKNRYGKCGLYYHKDVVDGLRDTLEKQVLKNTDLETKLTKLKENSKFTWKDIFKFIKK